MATYMIFYKCYYHEFSDWGEEIIEAPTPLDALQRFLKSRRIRRKARLDGEYEWWDGDWLMTYRGINVLDENERVDCPTCHGRGTVPMRNPINVTAT